MQNLAEEKPATAYAWYALGLLMVVYILNFLDRVIIFYLFPFIRSEMNFTYLQLSILGPTAFVIFYTVLGIPFGRWADKGSRKNLIAAGLVVWSLFSGLTGFAWDFWSLFFCRMMVGVGEATLGPAALSLLADYFPSSKRATVTSIYSMGIAIGAGLAALSGGWIGETLGWRWAFFIIGFPGILIAVLVYFLKENPRAGNELAEITYTSQDWKKLITNKSFILLCLGFAFFGLATNNLNIWGATFYKDVHGFSPKLIGFWAGILTLIAGIPATLLGGVMADRFRKKSKGGRLFYGAILSFISVPFWLLLIFTEQVPLIFLTNAILLFAALAWLGAAAADTTEISGVNLRGLAIAIYFFSVNIAAYLIGSTLIGYLSDKFGATENPAMMRYALLVCPISCFLSAICLYAGSKTRQN